MTKTLTGKVALVTGGSRGIGAASARALAEQGANVAISYVASPDKAEAVVADLKARGVQARAYKADQASSAEVDQLVNDVAKDFGRLDILVNNAGVAVGGPIDDVNTDPAALARQDAINVHGVISAIRAASPIAPAPRSPRPPHRTIAAPRARRAFARHRSAPAVVRCG